MRKLVCALFITFILGSCDKDNVGDTDSINLTATLKKSCANESQTEIFKRMEEFINQESSIEEYRYILSANYQEKSIFIFGNCCPSCNSLPPSVYNCSGDFLGRIDYFGNSGEEASVPFDKIMDKEIFWPEESKCNF